MPEVGILFLILQYVFLHFCLHLVLMPEVGILFLIPEPYSLFHLILLVLMPEVGILFLILDYIDHRNDTICLNARGGHFVFYTPICYLFLSKIHAIMKIIHKNNIAIIFSLIYVNEIAHVLMPEVGILFLIHLFSNPDIRKSIICLNARGGHFVFNTPIFES